MEGDPASRAKILCDKVWRTCYKRVEIEMILTWKIIMPVWNGPR